MLAESYSGWQSSQWLERCSQFIRGPHLLVIKKAEVWSNLGEAVVQWNRHKKKMMKDRLDLQPIFIIICNSGT